jgi:hypothetical protein
MADYMVNISVLKNHGTAGVTLCLKNHYGTCNSPGTIHGGDCDPYIPALNNLVPIKNTQCIHICDALFGVYSGGPGGSPQFSPNTLIMSRDIVAVDYWGRELLDDAGCSTIGQASHVDTAAVSYGLGTNNPGLMDVVNITNPAGVDDIPTPAGFVLQQNHPNPFTSGTRIRFYVARQEPVSMTVFDSTGRKVRGLIDRTLGAGWHQVPWNARNDSGRQVAPGVYYCQFKANGFDKAIIMQLIK